MTSATIRADEAEGAKARGFAVQIAIQPDDGASGEHQQEPAERIPQ
jgi:hypothetical protein